jgi:hypothetical protein
MLSQFCVLFNDGSGKVLMGKDKKSIRDKYPNVKRVFAMGIKHNNNEVIK